MKHAEAEVLLAEYGAGRLDPASRHDLERHLEVCEDCAGWLETYRLLAEVGGRSAHPGSGEIAEFALQPQRLPERTREEIERHLDICPDCGAEAELTRAAVAAARREPRSRLPAWAGAVIESPLRLAAAAALVLLIGLGAALFNRHADDPGEETLRGSRVLEAEEAILLAATDIEAGSSLVVRAGESVALGEGFSLGPDATLTIEVGSEEAER